MASGSVLITGANGFVGTHLLRRLEHLGVAVFGLARRAPKEASLWDGFICADIRDGRQVQDAVSRFKPTWVVHLAGALDGVDADLESVNLGGTQNLLAAVRCHAPEAVVLTVGSAAEYGVVSVSDLPIRETQRCVPVSPYGRTKLAATEAALGFAGQFGLNVTVARPFNILGAGMPESMVSGALIRRLKNALASTAPTIRVGNLESRRDFIDVNDVTAAFVRILEAAGFRGEVINLCSGRATSIRQLLETLLSVVGQRVDVVPDLALMRTSDAPVSYGCWEKAERLFGFVPQTDIAVPLGAAWAAAQSDS